MRYEAPSSRGAIAADLRRLGLGAGDLVMVHASLRAIGPVEGRADGLIDAIYEAIDDEGTMLMVLGATDPHAWVNDRPDAERVALLAEAQPFDPAATPSSPDVGTLAEVFRQRPEVRVSDHPEARFAAAGPFAGALLDDVPWDDYFGPGSPLAGLIRHEGKVLRMGAALNTVTALHHAEYLCAVEPKQRVRRHRLVLGRDGPEIRTVDCLDDEEGIVDYPGEDYFEDLLRDYLRLGRGGRGTVGGASCELLDAADVVAFGTRWMDRNLTGGPDVLTVAALTSRLDADLLAARRHRRASEVAAIRSLKSALANAQAVAVEERPYELVEGSADVPRRQLEPAELRAIVEAEVEERHRAIAQYRDAAADTGDLEQELTTLERYRVPS